MDASHITASYDAHMPDSLFYAADVPRDIGRYLASHGYNLSLAELVARIGTPSVRGWVADFVAHPPRSGAFEEAMFAVPDLRSLWDRLFDDANVTVLAAPTMPLPARPISDIEPAVDINGRREFYCAWLCEFRCAADNRSFFVLFRSRP